MHLSISSVLISLLLASILILVLHVLLTTTKIYHVFRIDFISVFALIIGFRLLFPFEFITTHTLSSHKVLPTLYSLANTDVYPSVHLSQICIVVWLLGSLVFLCHFTYRLLTLNKVRACSTELDTSQLAIRMKIDIPRNVKIRYLPYVSSPFVYRYFRPTIVLSNVPTSDEELRYIILHKLQHIRNRDIICKYISQILICMYWWFPLIWIFRKQVDTILEMRVDYQVTQTVDNSAYLNYVESLINVAKSISTESNTKDLLRSSLLSHFTILEKSTLKRRVKFLLEGFNVKRTSRAIRVCLFLVPIIATSIIIEPDYANPNKVSGTREVTSNDSYIVKKKSEFHLYINGTDMGSFKSLNDPILKGIPVKKK